MDGGQRDDKADALAASNPQETDELEAFCASVRYEEIPFEQWRQHHKQLDLQYPITVTRAELKQTYRCIIRLSRTVRKSKRKGEAAIREKIEYELQLHDFEGDARTIRVRGLGDALGDEVGDLCIMVRVKG